jgi:alkylhydroperoxidase family enzyme
MASNDRVGISIAQPRDVGERKAVAVRCCSSLKMRMPLLVDDLFDTVGHTYSGMPDRLYVIDRDGRVAYKSGRGPFGFKPGEMEQSLALVLLDQAAPANQRLGRVPMLDDAAAWKHLPRAKRGANTPLPAWARALAGPLPRTTAAMLELDYLHRAKSPLDPKLRGKLRWTAAHANRCAYAEAYAAADLRRAGVTEEDIRSLADKGANRPAAERAALRFARKMTTAASTVTDEEVAELRQLYGDGPVVAMVLLLAYANFQDRMLLTLDVPLEPGRPQPPPDVHFDAKSSASMPPRRPPQSAVSPSPGGKVSDPEWQALDMDQLQQSMEKQRARAPRIPVPSWDAVRQHMPPGYPADRPLRIRWSLVCTGYQPELARAWSACTRSFGEEARQDRVFEESLFWVVTRSLQCFY